VLLTNFITQSFATTKSKCDRFSGHQHVVLVKVPYSRTLIFSNILHNYVVQTIG